MSDYGLFEADEASGNMQREAARRDARDIDIAIAKVGDQFGRYLASSADSHDFYSRVAEIKPDMRKAMESVGVFPAVSNMRKVVNAMKHGTKSSWGTRQAGPIRDALEQVMRGGAEGMLQGIGEAPPQHGLMKGLEDAMVGGSEGVLQGLPPEIGGPPQSPPLPPGHGGHGAGQEMLEGLQQGIGQGLKQFASLPDDRQYLTAMMHVAKDPNHWRNRSRNPFANGGHVEEGDDDTGHYEVYRDHGQETNRHGEPIAWQEDGYMHPTGEKPSTEPDYEGHHRAAALRAALRLPSNQQYFTAMSARTAEEAKALIPSPDWDAYLKKVKGEATDKVESHNFGTRDGDDDWNNTGTKSASRRLSAAERQDVVALVNSYHRDGHRQAAARLAAQYGLVRTAEFGKGDRDAYDFTGSPETQHHHRSLPEGGWGDIGSREDSIDDQYDKMHQQRAAAAGRAIRTATAHYLRWCQASNLRPASAANLHYYAERMPVEHTQTLIAGIRVARRRLSAGGAASATGIATGTAAPTDMWADTGSGAPMGGGMAPAAPTSQDAENQAWSIAGSRLAAGPGDHLPKASDAITKLLNELAGDFQKSIVPLQDALQSVQFAQQQMQAQQPMNVVPPGSINVMPGGGAPGDPMQGQNMDASGGVSPMVDPNAAGPGGGDPAAGGAPGGDPSAGGGLPPEVMALIQQLAGGAGGGAPGGGDPAAAGGPPPQGGPQMQPQARRRQAKGKPWYEDKDDDDSDDDDSSDKSDGFGGKKAPPFGKKDSRRYYADFPKEGDDPDDDDSDSDGPPPPPKKKAPSDGPPSGGGDDKGGPTAHVTEDELKQYIDWAVGQGMDPRDTKTMDAFEDFIESGAAAGGPPPGADGPPPPPHDPAGPPPSGPPPDVKAARRAYIRALERAAGFDDFDDYGHAADGERTPPPPGQGKRFEDFQNAPPFVDEHADERDEWGRRRPQHQSARGRRPLARRS